MDHATTRLDGTHQPGRVFLAYAAVVPTVASSVRGSRSAIVEALRRRLRDHGHVVEIGNPCVGPMPPPQDYDTVVLGLPARAGHARLSIARYIEEHRAGLAQLPAALFAVAGRASLDPGAFLMAFLRAVDWQPDLAAAFGPRRDAPRAEVPDWDAVRRFADAIAAELATIRVLVPRFASRSVMR